MKELLSIPHPNPSPEGEGLRFAGYASVFDVVDRGGNVVLRGAFAGSGGKAVPLLWQHAPDKPVGVIEQLREDERGLRVIGRLSARTAVGREAAALLKAGAVDGLSFGRSEEHTSELQSLMRISYAVL